MERINGRSSLPEVVDIHVHVASNRAPCLAVLAPLGQGLDNDAVWDITGAASVQTLELMGGELAECLLSKLCEAEKVTRAVFLALDFRYEIDENGASGPDVDGTYYAVSNEYVRTLAWHNPNHVLFGASINPNRGFEESKKELYRCLGFPDGDGTRPPDGGPPPALIKWVPNSQGIDPLGVPEGAHDSFYRLLAEHKIPLLSHTGYEHFIPVPKDDQAFGNPRRLRRALECGVDVIAAHCAAWIKPDEPTEWVSLLADLMQEADRNRHKGWGRLYGDVAAFATLTRPDCAKEAVLRLIPPDRILLGSDAPVPVVHVPFLENPFDANLDRLLADGFPPEMATRAADVLNQAALDWAERHATSA